MFLFPFTTALLLVGTLLAACTSTTPEVREAPDVPTPIPEAVSVPTPSQIEAVRLGRYTLVELTAEEAQRDPLHQIVVITIPPAFEATIGTAITHVLARTGYRLCLPPPPLVHLPLPASHLHLGPVTLATALQTLAGPAWSLTVDRVERRVCFTRSPE
ncbi:MAG: hypothetical protein FWG52_10260 [Proteobacteria bacterium]|nr:hypothetical protein [Pseudomonadota bacterium]